jgi:alkanesulfonate monooxygenase SsuD/methylene tetrahydromethanopterin reductase-like flavin-dependent oxidoreductase (luciferase family)
VIEDCFYTAGIALAAAALSRTERLHVGIGILPAVARNPVITAMELATLANLSPGRLIAGIGHGVQSWMVQIGAATPSPLTTLDEVVTVVRRLLHGERVTFEGHEVTMRDVALESAPDAVPPVLAGVRGPRSLALAGRIADGVVLAEGAGPSHVRSAVAQAGAPPQFRVSVFTALCIGDDGDGARREMAPFLARLLSTPNVALDAHPHVDEMRARHDHGGLDALVTMPRSWWTEIGAIGTLDDAMEHIAALHEAGAHDVALFPANDVDVVRRQLDDVALVARAVRSGSR